MCGCSSHRLRSDLEGAANFFEATQTLWRIKTDDPLRVPISYPTVIPGARVGVLECFRRDLR